MFAFRRSLRIIESLLIATLLSIGLTAPPARAAPDAARLTGATTGYAYAGYLLVPSGQQLASVGPLFEAQLGCNVISTTVTVPGASLNLGGFASSGTLTDRIVNTRTQTGTTIYSSSQIQRVNVLNNLITASAVHTVVSTTANLSTAQSFNSSTFVNLLVNGVQYNPAPNTRVDLAGLGYVILNEQDGPHNGADTSNITAVGIDVYVNVTNSYNLPIGTRILIGVAYSSFTRTLSAHTLTTGAYGLYLTGLQGGVSSGPYDPVAAPCTGGSAAQSLVSVNVPNIGTTGTITDTANSQIGASSASGNASSTVQQINLLGGLITANAVTVSSNASAPPGQAGGSTVLTNAQINGITLSVHPTPNSQIQVPGVGYVVVNEQTFDAGHASSIVRALDLNVTTANSFGLPVGAHVVVAVAYVQVNSY